MFSVSSLWLVLEGGLVRPEAADAGDAGADFADWDSEAGPPRVGAQSREAALVEGEHVLIEVAAPRPPPAPPRPPGDSADWGLLSAPGAALLAEHAILCDADVYWLQADAMADAGRLLLFALFRTSVVGQGQVPQPCSRRLSSFQEKKNRAM